MLPPTVPKVHHLSSAGYRISGYIATLIFKCILIRIYFFYIFLLKYLFSYFIPTKSLTLSPTFQIVGSVVICHLRVTYQMFYILFGDKFHIIVGSIHGDKYYLSINVPICQLSANLFHLRNFSSMYPLPTPVVVVTVRLLFSTMLYSVNFLDLGFCSGVILF